MLYQVTHSDLKTTHQKFRLKAIHSLILFVSTCKSRALMSAHCGFFIYMLKLIYTTLLSFKLS